MRSMLKDQSLGAFKKLISPFCKVQNWCLDSFVHVTDIMIYARLARSRWEYSAAESRIIELLLRLAVHVDGAKSYVEAQVEQSSRSPLLCNLLDESTQKS